ncbi:uncharacterized protein HD556DRAFT_1441758 [Suillus plorans]|uniref:Uncharacterized protein n=1 Tax=Suillus plorans TaxID=116603 RepID=A0A9P7AF01_9AGAM|nr:uncharacterized protein HD556DRAFT_1448189 [Suillus plorans]XP_041155325.1 uncharacterized protein HD556DRAFT_1448206 [Suillus plorans]XP_041161576.1 uncharacterized protein HD556DRAFT_1441758 [Suillus plorans]KAG1809069.1 hypothetical protein EV424DRAFT_1543218 [Suillus variegatus]KAG1788021.1 hypothetical protein HD556DRAFT_1448189 [Suillus plorans]KAG1788039.1 hypothetical protein HD556DRAFT_1448206 [Suillus plorans]KAG1795923.1 hypothetical protein HD556DRAFT_1441758 [Suillus plorans]
MPRPPIHKTNQAKLQAAREKSQRHYAKESILKRRRELRVEKNKPTRETRQFEKAVARALKSHDDSDEDESDTELETDESSDDENDTPSDLPGCLLALKEIKDEMLSLTDDREPQKFVEDNLLHYVKSIKYTDDRGDNGDITIISNTMLKVQDILNRSIRVQDQLLNFCGPISDEFRTANSMSRFLSTTAAYLEEIDYLIHWEGVSELCVAHSLGELMYQKNLRV